MNAAQTADNMTGDRGRIPPDDGGGDGYGDTKEVTLDKSVPEISDAFDGCKVGDTYKVTADDDMSLTLEKTSAPEEAEPVADDAAEAGDETDNMPKSDNPAIAVMIAKRNKK